MADGPTVKDLPTFTDAEQRASIKDLEPSTKALGPNVVTLAPRIKDVAVKTDSSITLNSDILFDFAKADLTPVAQQKIAELTASIPPGAAVRVVGHTDSIGEDASNLTLSRQRAQAVADAITASRSDLQLTVDGRGEVEPVEPNEKNGEDNPDGRALNRRVVITS